jgi:hypothetical protein
MSMMMVMGKGVAVAECPVLDGWEAGNALFSAGWWMG